jgi:hypothetical protein
MMHVWWNSPSSGNDRLVLLAIADEADDAGRNAFPSVRRLAEKVNCHTATVLRCSVRLERAGEIEVDRPRDKARGRGNRYRVNMQSVPTADELRARYSDDNEQAARKMQPVPKSQTARKEPRNRAQNASKPRASVRADPKTRDIDPASKPSEAQRRLREEADAIFEADRRIDQDWDGGRKAIQEVRQSLPWLSEVTG